jgi:FkbM family methyltransferase
MPRPLRITFVLPGYQSRPNGGYRVVYEYANRLADLGHNITVLLPARITPWWAPDVWANRLALRDRLDRLRNRGRVPWFDFDPVVRVRSPGSLAERHLPEADVLVATDHRTAFRAAAAPPNKGACLHLIQHDERDLFAPRETVEPMWDLPLRKVVVASWLLDVAAEVGQADTTVVIPNGVNHEQFRLTRPIADRAGTSVVMLSHRAPWKGEEDGLEALEIARAELPELSAVLFGTEPRPARIPEWIDYEQNPSPERLVELYNAAGVFLHTSWSEGFGLPPAEAMACGCAVVAASNGGVQEFALHDETALLAAVHAPGELARHLVSLARDQPLRERLAEAGLEKIRREFTWERATESLQAEICRTVAAAPATSSFRAPFEVAVEHGNAAGLTLRPAAAPESWGPRAIHRLGPVQRVLQTAPVQLAASTRRLARLVTPGRRFALNQLTGASTTAGYRLRGSGVGIVLRHGTRDVWTFNELFELGLYEPPAVVAETLASLGRPALVVDLGANIGLYGALVLSRQPDARVVSFEPDPVNLEVLRRCMEMNRDLELRWELVPAFAAASAGAVTFQALGDPSSRATEAEGNLGTVMVEARDVFPFLEDADLLKMDIEGGEWELLADARFGDPLAVVLEYHPHMCPSEDPHGAAKGLLARAGYSTESILRSPDGHGMLWGWRQLSAGS